MKHSPLTLTAIAFGGLFVLATAAIAQRESALAPAKPSVSVALANLEPGNQWHYEYSWPNGKTHEFVLHTSKKIDTPTGTVFELKNFSNTLKGQLIISYEYLEARNAGIFEASNATFNNTKPGFKLSTKGAMLPNELSPGTTWRYNAIDGVGIDTGNASARTASSFVGKVLPSKVVNTPLGKKQATVIQVFEKVQWMETTKRIYYVPGLGKVREELFDAKGNLLQKLELKKFTKGAKEIIAPLTVDSGG